jgi:hypothetical protein
MTSEVIEIEKEIIAGNPSIRQGIMDFESQLMKLDGVKIGDSDLCPLKHSFSDGIYVREIFIPKGTVLTGKIHKHAHPNFLLEGEVDVVTESGGRERLVAPMSMISVAGTKRAVYAITDVRWVTIHKNENNETDLKKLEDDIIAKNYLEFENFAKGLEQAKTEKLLEGIKEINNCGLVALKNMCQLEKVSVSTLIGIANDNGLTLYSYTVPVDKLKEIPLPAIVHSENHFEYISKKEDFTDVKYSGNVLLTEKANFETINESELKNITGSTWAAAAAGSAALTLGIVKGIQNKHQSKREGSSSLMEAAIAANAERRRLESERIRIEEENKTKTLKIIVIAFVALIIITAIIIIAVKMRQKPV